MDGRTATQERLVRQLDGTDAEWKYRGRTELEQCEHQPIGAPAGVSAQKDEGFQRFYKAVVSPTHIRVTAGGRIVPNTRGSSSPTVKWAKEKPLSDGHFSQRTTQQGYAEMSGIQMPTHMPQPAPFGAFPHVFPGFVPAMHPGVAPAVHPPVALMPWQVGMNMASGYGMIHPHAVPIQRREAHPRPPVRSMAGEKPDEPTYSESSKSVRISPAEQFDGSRPFFSNGQWLMPAGGSLYPYGVASLPPFPVPGMPAPAVVQPRFHIPAMIHSPSAKLEQPLNAQVPSSSSTPSIIGHSPIPISSIRPSEITRKQIEVLRSSLRYFQDQLQYNKHQIDEQGMEAQAKMVRQQIQHFETNLKVQIEAEQAKYPTPEVHKDASSSTGRENGKDSTSSTANEAKSERESSHSSLSQGSLSNSQSMKTQKSQEPVISRRHTTLRQVKSMSAPVSAKITPESSNASDRGKSSALPVSAALAPPFHPRLDSTASVPIPNNRHLRSDSSAEDIDYARTKSEGFAGSSSSESFTEKPYLIGKLVSGVPSGAGGATGYVYGRELTEDELRARHMYWGKAPHHLQKGLPKFDGKDFYPPSPGKSEDAGSMANTKACSSGFGTSSKVGSGYAYKASKNNGDLTGSLGKSFQRPPRGAPGAMTQSEHLIECEQTPRSPAHSLRVPLTSCEEAVKLHSNFVKEPLQSIISSPDGAKDKSSDEGDDNSNILFRGRKYMAANKQASAGKSGSALKNDNDGNGKNRSEGWQRMWKQNKTSPPTAVTGAISSMTARGVLPNYAGHATASLTPTIANTSGSPKTSSPKPPSGADVASPRHRPDKTTDRHAALPVKRGPSSRI